MLFLLCFLHLGEADRHSFAGNHENIRDYDIKTESGHNQMLFLDQNNLKTLGDESRKGREMAGKNAVKVNKLGKKRCRKYGYKHCVTYQQINQKIFTESDIQIVFPNGEKVTIASIPLTPFSSSSSALKLLKMKKMVCAHVILSRPLDQKQTSPIERKGDI